MKKKFKIPLRDGSTKEVRFADAFQMYGLRFVVHRSAGINLRQDTDSLGNGWEVSEYSTGCAATGIRLCVRAAILNILALQINLISRLTYSRCYGAFLIQNQNDSNSKVSGSNLLR